MTPALTALAGLLFYGVGIFIGGIAARTDTARLVFLVGQFAGALILIPIILITKDTERLTDIAWGAAAGALATAGTVANLRALSMGQMTLIAPLAGLSKVLTTFIAALILGQVINDFGYIALALGLLSVAFIAPRRAIISPGSSTTQRLYQTPAALAVIAGVCVGLQFATLRLSSSETGFITLLTLRVSAIILLTPFIPVSHISFKSSFTWLLMVVSGLLLLLGDIFAVVALHTEELLVTGIILSLAPAVVVTLGWIILKEKLSMRQCIGIVAAVLSIALFALAH